MARLPARDMIISIQYDWHSCQGMFWRNRRHYGRVAEEGWPAKSYHEPALTQFQRPFMGAVNPRYAFGVRQ